VEIVESLQMQQRSQIVRGVKKRLNPENWHTANQKLCTDWHNYAPQYTATSL